MSVDLPEPFWPTSAWTSPGRMSRDASMRARVPAKVFERCETRRASRAAVGVAVDIVRLSPPASSGAGHAPDRQLAPRYRPPELMSIRFRRTAHDPRQSHAVLGEAASGPALK